MDPTARTIRFDLTVLSRDRVLEFLQQQDDIVEKIIVYEEIADKTGKLHIQGWMKFGSKKQGVNFADNRLRKFKLDNGVAPASASCAAIKKDTYFAYTAKDGKCVYSFGVSEDERIAHEEKSFKKQSRDTIPGRVIAMFEGQVPTRSQVARALTQIYGDEDRLMYAATMSATVNLIMFKLDPESMLARFEHQL
ncbi:MAG: replication protein [Cressdnaviricota sp.]|nr:MAG: replication protein [Cressdnaviricota sp.]